MYFRNLMLTLAVAFMVVGALACPAYALAGSGVARSQGHAKGLYHGHSAEIEVLLNHFGGEDGLFMAVYEQVAGLTNGYNADGELAIADSVLTAALQEGIDPFLILAVISVESSFTPWAKSSAGALGLMQVKPATGEAFAPLAGVRWRGSRTLFHTESNIRIGTNYLAFKLERFDGDLVLALAAYCHGPTRIRRLLRTEGELEPEMKGYSRKVLRMYEHYRGTLGLPVS